jgi:hypothetical protein
MGQRVVFISSRRSERVSEVRNSSSLDGGDVEYSNTEFAFTMILKD